MICGGSLDKCGANQLLRPASSQLRSYNSKNVSRELWRPYFLTLPSSGALVAIISCGGCLLVLSTNFFSMYLSSRSGQVPEKTALVTR